MLIVDLLKHNFNRDTDENKIPSRMWTNELFESVMSNCRPNPKL